MIVWLLLLMLEMPAPSPVPLEIFPNSSEGRQACEAAAADLKATIPQAQALECARYTLAPNTEMP